MSAGPDDRLRRERDLYRRCLEIGTSSEPEPLLLETLELLRGITRAEAGYIELRDLSGEHEQHWAASLGVDKQEHERIRDQISQGVIAEAVETGTTVHTPSALLDRRFADRASVRRSGIQAVLCVPLRAAGVVGVVYLQNRIDGGPFGAGDIACVETVASFVSEIGARLLELLRRRGDEDPTRTARGSLRASAVIGSSRALAHLLERVVVVATMEANVLLTGPSGTGKSLFARVLHDNSRRCEHPFVEINCAALPENLVESELFGADRGAHSAVAERSAMGKVAAAEGGTLFLDEVGEASPSVQAKLLQLIQSKEYYRLGAAKPTRANVRIVAATNRDLEAAVAARTFRDDFYYRLRSVRLRVPTLADRRGDVPALAEHFCAESCRRDGLAVLKPTPDALAALENEDWPGNVRELASRCEEGVLNARLEGAGALRVHHFFPDSPVPPAGVETFLVARARWESAFLAAALLQRDWNVAETARELEMSRSHLNALIRRYGLRR